MQFRIWADVCNRQAITDVSAATPGDNIYQADCDKLLTEGSGPIGPVIWALADSVTPNIFTGSGPLLGKDTYYIGVEWGIPDGVGNIIQSDKYQADISFYTEQWRNNPNFKCVKPVHDYVDIGNVTSEAGHNISTTDWSDPWVKPGWGGNYGGGSSDASLRLLMGKGDSQGCVDLAARPATFTMNADGGIATKLTLEHLDGAVNDSFELFINGISRGTYIATSIGGNEVWKTTTFTFPGVTGTVNVELYATHPVTSWCADWGQVAFSNALLE